MIRARYRVNERRRALSAGAPMWEARGMGWSRVRGAVPALLLAWATLAAAPARAGADPCATRSGRCADAPLVVVMSAFPAEQRLLLARTAVGETLVVADRTVHVGTLAGTRVALVLSGIGLANAAHTTDAMLARFDVGAILFSGVAGSDQRIGDVVVPATWTDSAGQSAVDATLLALAAAIAPAQLPFVQCTANPPEPPGPDVCLGRTPRLAVGGDGMSEDPFGGAASPCTPGGGPIFGCEPWRSPGVTHAATPVYPTAIDMETSVVARRAAAAGVPFLAFRGVSDGPGDPLDLGGFPAQFFAYYALAADNAALATIALLEAWAPHGAAAPPSGSARARAACGWARAGGTACATSRAPGGLTRGLDKACRLDAAAAAAAPDTPHGAALGERAQHRFAALARRVRERGARGIDAACRAPLAALLEGRAASAP